MSKNELVFIGENENRRFSRLLFAGNLERNFGNDDRMFAVASVAEMGPCDFRADREICGIYCGSVRTGLLAGTPRISNLLAAEFHARNNFSQTRYAELDPHGRTVLGQANDGKRRRCCSFGRGNTAERTSCASVTLH